VISRPAGRRRQVDGAIDRLLAEPDVEYVHVRSTRAGCFLCRLEGTPAA
jgi:hypothetical protein